MANGVEYVERYLRGYSAVATRRKLNNPPRVFNPLSFFQAI
jgi:hypothetical protein